jgi:hypothetical protein
LQAQREHQQHHPDLGHLMRKGLVRKQRYRHMRPDDEPGHQVAEHDGLPDATEDKRGQGGHAHNDREVGQHTVGKG